MTKVILIMVLSSFLFFCEAQNLNELIDLDKYAEANSLLLLKKESKSRVVFIGNSITENWVNLCPDFFTLNNYIGRGVSGQTSAQLLLRFRQDVLDLNPYSVVINTGTNDIAENTGTYDPKFTLDNIKSMAELAHANGIRVILSSVLPAEEFPWRTEIKNVPNRIDALNAAIKKYAAEKRFSYVDYNTPMRDSNGAMKIDYASDGVHPTPTGYEVMKGIVKKELDKKWRNKSRK
jgi:lysophospholipase L1-like esterase